MKQTTHIKMKDGTAKTYRNYGSAVNFFLNNFKSIETTSDALLNQMLLKVKDAQ